MMRFFNTAGPVVADRHYCLAPLDRFDLDEMLGLIDQWKYFVLHAPRQTGKTSCLLALMKHLNQSGQYRALYANLESAQAARENVTQGMAIVVQSTALRARDMLGDSDAVSLGRAALESNDPGAALEAFLTNWCLTSDKPTVLLLDEVDALVGDTLISLLRQLRSGYDKRPVQFPQTIVLCGVRDVRDYRIHSDKQKSIITGGSAFNIRAESLRLGDFTQAEIDTLYHQHTVETGQPFESGVFGAVWDLTHGQPWLVNALGYETCFKMKENRDRSKPITAEMVQVAKENLILRRETHLDQLADKLQEERVRGVIEPLLAGESLERVSPDNIQYVEDLGLIRRSSSGFIISNAIYREIIPRELTYIMQLNFESTFEPAWYVLPDGSLDMEKLLSAFQEFFREHSEHWVERFEYKEAGPQLLLQAFLQRIINGGGRVEREYGLGRKRTDLLLIWPLNGRLEEPGVQRQKVVLELKIVHGSLERTIKEGLQQTASYMDRSGTDDGHLILFDREPQKPWDDKIFRRDEKYDQYRITIWGM